MPVSRAAVWIVIAGRRRLAGDLLNQDGDAVEVVGELAAVAVSKAVETLTHAKWFVVKDW